MTLFLVDLSLLYLLVGGIKGFVIGGTFVVLVDVVIKVHYNKRQIPISVAKS